MNHWIDYLALIALAAVLYWIYSRKMIPIQKICLKFSQSFFEAYDYLFSYGVESELSYDEQDNGYRVLDIDKQPQDIALAMIKACDETTKEYYDEVTDYATQCFLQVGMSASDKRKYYEPLCDLHALFHMFIEVSKTQDQIKSKAEIHDLTLFMNSREKFVKLLSIKVPVKDRRNIEQRIRHR